MVYTSGPQQGTGQHRCENGSLMSKQKDVGGVWLGLASLASIVDTLSRGNFYECLYLVSSVISFVVHQKIVCDNLEA